MSEHLSKLVQAIKGWWKNLSDPDKSVHFPKTVEEPLNHPSPEEARIAFRSALTDYVANGWTIEIENEFDAVISHKRQFRWILRLFVFLLLLLVIPPLAFIFLLVVIVISLTAKAKRTRIWIDPEGRIQTK